MSGMNLFGCLQTSRKVRCDVMMWTRNKLCMVSCPTLGCSDWAGPGLAPVSLWLVLRVFFLHSGPMWVFLFVEKCFSDLLFRASLIQCARLWFRGFWKSLPGPAEESQEAQRKTLCFLQIHGHGAGAAGLQWYYHGRGTLAFHMACEEIWGDKIPQGPPQEAGALLGDMPDAKVVPQEHL